MVQYVLVLAVIAVVVLGVVQVVGKRTNTAYCSVNQGLQKGAGCPGQTQFTNLVPNPKLDHDATGYTRNCFAITGEACAVVSSGRITSDAPSGASASYEAVFNSAPTRPNSQIYFGLAASQNFPVAAGQVISMSAEVKVATGPAGASVTLSADYTGATALPTSPACGSVYAGNGPTIGTATLDGGWQLLQGTFTVAPTKTCFAIDFISSTLGANITLRVSQLSVVVSDTVIPYFDGDSLNGTWTGAPGNSTSTGWVDVG